MIEQSLGKLWFILIYLIGGVLTAILSLLLTYFVLGLADNMIGASGALSVLMGLFGYMYRHYLSGLFVAMILISFVPLLMGIPVAWYAHLIGFVLGIGTGAIIKYISSRRGQGR